MNVFDYWEVMHIRLILNSIFEVLEGVQISLIKQ